MRESAVSETEQHEVSGGMRVAAFLLAAKVSNLYYSCVTLPIQLLSPDGFELLSHCCGRAISGRRTWIQTGAV
jgi:hypothetical protein